MSGISTHVLDLSTGKPAPGVRVRLEADGVTLSDCLTDDDGRVTDLLGARTLQAETYRLTFVIGPYFTAQGLQAFYPEAQVLFTVSDVARHHHIPLLLSSFGYSTYRGS